MCAFVAFSFWWRGREAKGNSFVKKGLALIGISWILTSILGALPYLFVLPDCHWADALFESVSGISTTGASVFTGFEQFPRSLLFWRCLSQWIGGLGVAVLFVALLSSLGAGAKILFSNESSGSVGELEETRVQHSAFRMMQVYVGLTLLCGLSFFLWYGDLRFCVSCLYYISNRGIQHSIR